LPGSDQPTKQARPGRSVSLTHRTPRRYGLPGQSPKAAGHPKATADAYTVAVSISCCELHRL
jgi:hypothetical protein